MSKALNIAKANDFTGILNMIKYLFKQRQTKPNKVSENIYKKYFNIIISKLKKGKILIPLLSILLFLIQ